MKNSLQLKSVTGLWAVILGSSTDLSCTKQEATDDKTTTQSFKLCREWWLSWQALWNLIHCKYKSNFPPLNSMGRDCCREWKVWATSSSFWSYTVVVNIFKAIFSAFIACYLFCIGNKNIFLKIFGQWSRNSCPLKWGGVSI